MHLQIFPAFCVFMIINFIHFPILLGADNEQYTNCSRSYPCANIPDIPYPFWGGDKPEYCGNPNFKLNCQGEAPNITINSRPYRVLSINNATFTLNVARDEFWNNNCPTELHNATLDATHFQYAPSTEDLMLYYGCRVIVAGSPIPNQFNCSENQIIDTFGIYVTANLASNNTLNALNVNCSDGVSVRVNQTAAAALADNSSGNITQVLNSGFGLVWEANNTDCQSCVGSGGRCGTNSTGAGSFVCYCPDGNYSILCNSTKTSSGSNDLNLNLKLVIGYSVGGIAILLLTMTICYLKRPRTTLFNKVVALMKKVRADEQNVEGFLNHYESLAPKQYKYSDLDNMTNSFKDKLGQGAYGAVYKGKLLDGRLVAVKILSETKGNGEEFINEVASISRTSHVNVVALLGFCFERNRRALVYEFMAKGSLDKFIYENDCHLELRTLYQIAIDTARGLEYLHRGCSTRIVHFDIKPQNILLDEDFSPKISDFGLAQLCQRKESIISVMGARGTAGYIAPEVFSRAFGRVSHKSDVYSYGMLVLEMIGAREKVGGVSQTSEIYFPDWIYEHLEHRRDLILRGVNTTEEEETTRKMILVGLWCIQTNPLDRPRMSRVVEMLEGSLESLQIPPKPMLYSPARPDLLGEEYSSESLSTVTNGVDMSEESLRSLQIPSEPVQVSPSGTG
ncbi:Leaf rust 10 disease-resistance locus receptor-like protein kinase [Actinidia chinensis var. chinensis]|uniref:non-specific serine/threonine protein kinase n=1 Tax=Actinidia chinensis var. chinensis TaxID=1590841 RepID=A0A2R6RU99_ACTCC|nr:Leaf rust 10 disease-resistance locus receptor-like protein kinase [Actinidia chinensis var. chinensis]